MLLSAAALEAFQAGHAGSIPVARSAVSVAGQGMISSVRGLPCHVVNRVPGH
jgi:hypothetical protein